MFSIVVIVPHPDDESALCAGLILRALQKSVDVKVVFLTSGAHGRTLGLVPQAALAAERRKEAELATRTLGVSEVHFLDYNDFDPRRQKIFAWAGARRKLLSSIGAVSSRTVIVSFPPNGINGHPDHVRCSRLASDLARDKKAALLCVTASGAQTPYVMDPASYMKSHQRQKLHLPPTHILRLTGAEKAAKLWALSHYRTQALSVIDYIRKSEGNLFEEYYALAKKPGPQVEKFLSGLLKMTPAAKARTAKSK